MNSRAMSRWAKRSDDEGEEEEVEAAYREAEEEEREGLRVEEGPTVALLSPVDGEAEALPPPAASSMPAPFFRGSSSDNSTCIHSSRWCKLHDVGTAGSHRGGRGRRSGQLQGREWSEGRHRGGQQQKSRGVGGRVRCVEVDRGCAPAMTCWSLVVLTVACLMLCCSGRACNST